ncbi:FG-GAP repeat domain-containing protein [Nannocystaceae bacterium ST9]
MTSYAHLAAGLIVASTAGCTIEIPAIVEGGDEATELDEGSEGEDESGDASTGEAPLLDMAQGEPMPTPYCQIPANALDGLPVCAAPEISEVLAPTIGWTWTGPGDETSVLLTPLVANLDDDDGDGFVDLCDTPDVLVAAVDLPPGKTDVWPLGHLHVIDGRTGQTTRTFEHPIDAAINPAIADLDGDGRPEVLALEPMAANSPYAITSRRLVAFDGEGALVWQGEHWQAARGAGAIAVADLDGDGDPEILAPEYVADHEGNFLWGPADPSLAYSMPVAVDLDLDGQLEVLFGSTAYDHQGELRFQVPGIAANRGSVAVANFDDDPEPELYVQANVHGIVEHDGVVKAVCPTNDEIATGGYPVAIRDLDGDGAAEIVFGFADHVYVLAVEADQCFIRWSRKLDMIDAQSSGTMFDLLGDGRAEAIYADQSKLVVFADDGSIVFQIPRTAREEIANPVVADVDGDGAAEVLVVSSEPVQPAMGTGDPAPQTPSLMLLQNLDDAFAPARRLWNQHAYTSGASNELGQVPSSMSTPLAFRTNAPLAESASAGCIPALPAGSN